jgi:hypothetical protein
LRRAHVLAAAGAALLLASCSSQPNDLRDSRYYGDAESPAVSPPSPSATPRPMPAAVPSTPPKPRDLARFAVTAADLAAEGVQPSGTPARAILAALPDCNVALPEAKAGYRTAWSYPTGATLRQYVAEFDDDAGTLAESVTDKLACGKYRAEGVEVTVRAPVTAPDGQVSWCAVTGRQSSCTVLRTDGVLLSVIVVSAAGETKARQAVTRIAPLAATALARTS